MIYGVVLILFVQLGLGFRIHWTRYDEIWPVAATLIVAALSYLLMDGAFKEVVAMVLPNVKKVPMTTVIVQIMAHLIGGALTIPFRRDVNRSL